MRYGSRSEHASVCEYVCVCVIPNVRQIIWSAALKQRGSGPVHSHGEATFGQERENETT